MKVLNFSCVEILHALLDKSKTQTIRPAWKDYPIKDGKVKFPLGVKKLSVSGTYGRKNWKAHTDKPPRFKVGEQIKLFWKQRCKYKWFNMREWGIGLKQVDCFNPIPHFNKHLGIAEITRVFKLEMSKEPNLMGGWKLQVSNPNFNHEEFFDSPFMLDKEIEDLAKRDGFSSAEQLFSTLGNMYDLSSSKEFYVHRWKWLK